MSNMNNNHGKNSNSNNVVNSSVKQERQDEAEIRELAAKFVEANKAKMAIPHRTAQTPGQSMNILSFLSSDKNKSAKVPAHSTLESEIKNVDEESVIGHFGWTCMGKVHIPYIIRGGECYCAVRMVETKVLNKWLNYLHQDLYNCTNIRSYYITDAEARLLNEINFKHCDYQFGREQFTSRDLIVRLTDANEFFQFLGHCYNKLVNTVEQDTASRCGFIRINRESVVPYTVYNDQKYVPLFYFEGETDNLKQRADKLEGWDLSYLKFCCKVQGIRNELFAHDSCSVISLNDIKNYFPPGTLFEDYWPKKNLDSSQLLISGRTSQTTQNIHWTRQPTAPPISTHQVASPKAVSQQKTVNNNAMHNVHVFSNYGISGQSPYHATQPRMSNSVRATYPAATRHMRPTYYGNMAQAPPPLVRSSTKEDDVIFVASWNKSLMTQGDRRKRIAKFLQHRYPTPRREQDQDIIFVKSWIKSSTAQENSLRRNIELPQRRAVIAREEDEDDIFVEYGNKSLMPQEEDKQKRNDKRNVKLPQRHDTIPIREDDEDDIFVESGNKGLMSQKADRQKQTGKLPQRRDAIFWEDDDDIFVESRNKSLTSQKYTQKWIENLPQRRDAISWEDDEDDIFVESGKKSLMSQEADRQKQNRKLPQPCAATSWEDDDDIFVESRNKILKSQKDTQKWIEKLPQRRDAISWEDDEDDIFVESGHKNLMSQEADRQKQNGKLPQHRDAISWEDDEDDIFVESGHKNLMSQEADRQKQNGKLPQHRDAISWEDDEDDIFVESRNNSLMSQEDSEKRGGKLSLRSERLLAFILAEGDEHDDSIGDIFQE